MNSDRLMKRCTSRILFLIVFTVLVSCKKPPAPSELYDMYRNGVALVKTSYYYEANIDNGFDFYFSIQDGEPRLHILEEDAIENAGEIYGTAFFISYNGELATNRHIVYPSIDDEDIGADANAFMNLIIDLLKEIKSELEKENREIADNYNRYYNYLSAFKLFEIRNKFQENLDEINKIKNMLRDSNFNPRNTKIKMKRILLSIALNDSDNDFIDCNVIKKSPFENIDLAILQLKNKQTPARVTKVFDLANVSDYDIKLQDQVYMIGFNYGYELAQTKYGLKAQFTDGVVTQEPDGERLLYSIPTLEGSSGSPIIDKWGNLVAVNFAKIRNTQGFNFGVPATRLAELNMNPSSKVNEHNGSNSQKASFENNDSRGSARTAEPDYSSKIKDYFVAEDTRDFDIILSFYSDNITRYWDLYNPTLSQLKASYEQAWGYTSNAQTTVVDIVKVTSTTYNVRTKFEFYDKRREKSNTVYSDLRIEFNRYGKITEVYKRNS